jgi:hypothetical protein
MTTATDSRTEIGEPQAQDVLARVTEMRRWLRERQAEAERQRRISVTRARTS